MKHLTILLLLISSLGYSQVLDYPQPVNEDNQIVEHTGYVLSYNETCEQANWVKHMITKDDLNNSVAERKNKFVSDSLVETESANPKDYYKSGYDRGHLAPAADFVHDQNLMNESFMMSNMSPQHPSLNRGMWKRLENLCRSIALSKDTIYVISGGVLSKDLKKIGDNEVCVPDYYYKILIDSKGNVIKCFLMQNMKLEGNVLDYVVSIDKIEELTNFKFD